MKIGLMVLFCLSFIQAKETIWQGKIGTSEIFLHLPCEVRQKLDRENDCSYGRYFYSSSLQDIKFESSLPANSKYKLNLQVKHSLEDNAKVEELFELNYVKGILIGHWTHRNKYLKVLLKPYKLSQNAKGIDEFFDKIRTKSLIYSRENVEKIKAQNKEIVWIEEAHSQSRMFRLSNGFSKKTRYTLNPLFDKKQEADSLFYLTCTSRWAYGTGVESLENRIEYISSDLLSYSNSSSYFCGGAHPDFGTSYKLYDLHTAKAYKLEDIIKFREDVPKDNETTWEARAKYDELLAQKLRELAFQAEGMLLQPQGENDTYDPYDLSHWFYMDWAYEKDGIRFYLTFPSVSRCYRGDSFLIPFKLLKPYKNKSFPYEF